MVDYKSSIKRPFLDIKNLLIGILLSIFPIVNWFSLGYALECTGLTKKKLPLAKSPQWTDWTGMFIKGFFAWLISVIYFLPAIIIFVIGLIPVMGMLISSIGWDVLLAGDSVKISQAISANLPNLGTTIAVAAPFILIGLLLGLLAAYLLPMGVMNFVNSNNLAKGFSFSEIFKKAFTGKYLGNWLIVLIITIVLGWVVGIIFGWIPAIGKWLGNAVTYFIGYVIAFSIYGQVYKEIKK